MYQENFLIAADSACDLFHLDNIPFNVAPLKIITTQNEYVDDEYLNTLQMVKYLEFYKGKSSTSCPNTEDWLNAFGDAKFVFCVTITGTLSGSYNAASLAKKIYEEKHPNRRVFIINTLSAGPEIALIIEKIAELTVSGIGFNEICEKISKYKNQTGLLFMLESMKNLANNGRVSPLVAKMAGILGIRVVGKASEKGDLQPLNKCRGENKALKTIFEHMIDLGFNGGKVNIAHCFNPIAANTLKEMINNKYNNAVVKTYSCGGLCSFYAEKGGLLVGFEKERVF